MKSKDLHNHYTKYFFAVLFVTLLYLSFLILKPFISTIIFGLLVAYIAYPVYNKSEKYIKNKNIRAFLVALIFIIIIISATVGLVNAVLKQSTDLYVQSKKTILRAEIPVECENEKKETFICKAREFIEQPKIKQYASNAFTKILTFLLDKASEFIISIPGMLIGAFITVMTAFYCLRDGTEFLKRMRKTVPLKLAHQDEIFKQINNVIFAVLYGSLIVALIQGALGAVGFFIFGIQSPLFWGIVMAVFALIPLVGTGVIWLPASLILIFSGYATNEQAVLWRGIGLFFYGALIVSSIDNLIRPHIISGRANIHPLLVFLGALGGIILFGVVGFILGPLVLALFAILFEIYEKERLPHIK